MATQQAPPLLRRGANGEAVRELQERLKSAGYDVEADGVFGVDTEAAVREFQKRHKLEADGIAGPATIDALERAAPQARPQPARKAAIRKAEPAPTRSELTGTVVTALGFAAATARLVGADTLVDSGHLVEGIYRLGMGNRSRTATFLVEQIMPLVGDPGRFSEEHVGELSIMLELGIADPEDVELSDEGPPPESRMDGDLRRVIDRAREVAAVTARTDHRLRPRHLLAAILTMPESRGSRVLRAVGLDLATVREAFAAFAARSFADNLPEAWAALLDEFRRLPTYDADTAATKDALGIEREVEALASLAAARDVKPPLAIGLFGDWGTGKSYFMERMWEQVAQRSAQSRAAKDAGHPTAFCSHVRQIRFNAWHYADANLWASLVSHIFDMLARPDQPGGADPNAAESQQLLAQSELHRAALEAARRGQDGAGERKRKLEQRLADVEAGSDARVAYAARAAASAAIEQEGMKATLDGVASTLGVAEATPEGIKRFATEVSGFVQRVRYLWRLLAPGQRALVGVGGALAVVLLVLAALYFPLLATVVPVLATVAGWLARLREPWKRVSEATKAIADAAKRVEEREEAEQQKQRESLAHEIARLEEAEGQLAEAAEEERRLLDAVEQQIRAAARLYSLGQFVQERSASEDYRQHLGVVATIRRDFQSLSELLQRAQVAAPEDDLPQIDRIVLYVDDLDRCPAARVVQVLEAVHLLLAFDLFVVVVGVDSRWLLRSLERHYSSLLALDDGSGDGELQSSTPQNYLEKIFQVPFALRPMDAVGFGRLVDSLAGPRPAETVHEEVAAPREEHVEARDQEPAPGADDSAERDESEAREPKREEREQAPEVDLNPRSIELQEHELAFMRTLAPLIPTPRAAKRLVNVYRLVRSLVPGRDRAAFLGNTEKPGEYRAAMVLTAAVTGFPAEADELLERVSGASPGQTWRAFVAQLGDAEGDEARLYAGLRRLDARSLSGLRLDAFQRSLPLVSRFSFGTGRSPVVDPTT